MSNIDKLLFQDSCRMHIRSSESDKAVDTGSQLIHASFRDDFTKLSQLTFHRVKSKCTLACIFAFCMLLSVSAYAQVCATTFTTPPSPAVISGQPYISTFHNVQLNGGTNVASVIPNSTVTISFKHLMNFSGAYCPGCVTFHQIGLGGTQTTISCLRGQNPVASTPVNTSFTAPATPGVYYISMVNTLDYQCNTVNYDNSAVYAIAVVVVRDITDPIITCPASLSKNTDLDVCGAVTTFATATATDNCGAIVAQTAGLANGSTFPVGTSSVTFTATDAAGNSSSCSFNVVVTDNQAPVFNNVIVPTIPKTISMLGRKSTYTNVQLNGGSNYISVTGGTSVTLTYNRVSGYDGGAGCPGCITQHYIGLNGIFSECHNAGFGSSSVSRTFTAPSTPGIYYITQTATWWYYCNQFGVPANSNNPSEAIAVVVVQGGSGTFIGSNITQTADVGQCSAVITYTMPTASDNCGVAVAQTSGISSGSAAPVGTTTNIFTATDASGNTSSYSFTVTVTDNEKPIITCPTPLSKNTDLGVCGAVTTFATATATDNCGATVAQTAGLANGATFPVGTSSVTFTATDAAGNTSSCSFDVVVTDNQAPVFNNVIVPTIPKTISMLGRKSTYTNVQLNGGSNYISVTGGTSVTLTYNRVSGYDGGAGCPGCITQHYIGLNGVFSECHNAGGGSSSVSRTFNAPTSPGIYYITQTATWWYYCNQFGVPANSNNPSEAIAVVVVQGGSGAFIGSDITQTADVGQCSAVITYTTPTASDNCGVAVAQTSGISSGSAAPVGTTTNIFTATDASGNTSSYSFTVTVTDNEKPKVTCPTNIVVSAAANVCEAQVFFTVSATDNCAFNADITAGLASGSIFPVGTTTNMFTATDASGNTSSCSFTVTVTDNQAPTFTRPADVTLYKDANCTANTTIANTGDVTNEADNCSTGIEATYSDVTTAGSCEGTYTITRTWHLVDANNNAATDQIQTITVLDNTAPTFTRPVNVTLYKDATCSSNTTIANTGDVTNEADNCSTGIEATYSDVTTAGTCEGTYTITRTWHLVDKCGNAAADQVQTITVKDNIAPTFTLCPSAKVRSTNLSVCTYTTVGNEFDASATDNCSTPVMTYELSGVTVGTGNTTLAGVVFAKGITTVKWTATDACGNKTTCSFTITVNDTEKPIITCPASASRNTNPGLCTYSVVGSEFNATATDNCAVIGLSYVLSGATTGTGTTLIGVKLYVGTTTVTWTAVDAAGNTKTCSYTVMVNDDQNPTSYIIYATKEVKFGEYNYINGDIGVTAADGKASFKKYDVLNPYSVTAKNIDFDLPSSVSNRIYSPATGGPNPPFLIYNGNTSGLSNITVSSNAVLAGNYKDLTIKKGVVATIQGNNFGKISIEEGAQVTFSSAVINMEDLDIKGGKKDVSTTNVSFTNPSYVKVKDKVKIDADCRVNVGGPKVTFYLGDNSGDEEKFTVKGDNTQVTANIMIPNGKLKVNGGESRMSIMTGWYIVEKLESTGKFNTWNKYDCSMPAPSLSSASKKVTADINVHAERDRNVISFVTNQGLKTDYWTAEKLNNTTGNFEKLALQNNVKPTDPLQYLTFYDNTPSEGDNFYRIQLTYVKGEVAYSAVEKVTIQKTSDFTIYPNPADNEAWIDLKSFEGRQVTLVLSDMLGKAVQQYNIQKATAAPYRLDVVELPTGLYLVKVQAQGKRVFMRKLQVTK